MIVDLSNRPMAMLSVSSLEHPRPHTDAERQERLTVAELRANQCTDSRIEPTMFVSSSLVGSLRVLELSNNLMGSVPEDLGCLTALEELNLSGNGLTSLPY
eukprot:Selendium_serpulae@DN10910_c0_g1_i1.p1